MVIPRIYPCIFAFHFQSSSWSFRIKHEMVVTIWTILITSTIRPAVRTLTFAYLSSNSSMFLRKAFLHFLQTNVISVARRSGWFSCSAWHSAQSNHFRPASHQKISKVLPFPVSYSAHSKVIGLKLGRSEYVCYRWFSRMDNFVRFILTTLLNGRNLMWTSICVECCCSGILKMMKVAPMLLVKVLACLNERSRTRLLRQGRGAGGALCRHLRWNAAWHTITSLWFTVLFTHASAPN